MQSLFRFVILRPPQLRTLNAIAIPLDLTSFGHVLQALRQGEAARERVLEAAASFLKGPDFGGAPSQLPLAVEFSNFERAVGAQSTVTRALLQDLIQQAFGKTAAVLARESEFKNLRQRVVDGVLALKLRPDVHPRLFAPYVQLLRMIDLVERVRARDESLEGQTPRALLRRMVQLPAEIFPLPREVDKTKPPPGDDKAKEDRLKLTANLREVEHAIRELFAFGSADLAARRGAPTPDRDELPGLRLKPTAIARLSPRTKKLLTSLDMSLEAVPLRAAVARLEAEAQRDAGELARLDDSRAPRAMVRVGGTTLPSFSVDERDLTEPEGTKVPTTVGLVRPSGLGSLLVVRQQIKRYETGEISYVENVLRSQHMERKTRRLDRIEETFVKEVETTREQERVLQSTARQEFGSEAEKTIKEDESFKIGATISGGFGPFVQAEVSTEYATSTAEEDMARTAYTFASDVTDRTTSKITERVREERTIHTIHEFEENNSHGFDNTTGADHVIGIYQWLDRIYEAQVYDYGMRLFFDIMVPEPAGFLLASLEARLGLADGSEPPEAFTIKPDELSPTNYSAYVNQYQATGVEAPPPEYITIPLLFEFGFEEGTENQPKRLTTEIIIPPGYLATEYLLTYSWRLFSGFAFPFLHLSVGQSQPNILLTFPEEQADSAYHSFAQEEAGSIGVWLRTDGVSELVLAIEVICRRAESYHNWQLKTHEAIMQGYLKLKAAHEEKLAQLSAQQGVVIEGRNPLENRQIERTELKRLAISTITGQHFDKFSAVLQGASAVPNIDFDEADAEGKYARFFELAFEWEQLTYDLYPYFWGRKSTWVDRLLTRDVDPLHAEFLKAGYARLRLAVRPDFERALLHYLDTGEIWEGGELPEVASPDNLGFVADVTDRREQSGKEIPIGEPWDIRLPTTLVRVKPTPTLPEWQKDEQGNWTPVNND